MKKILTGLFLFTSMFVASQTGSTCFTCPPSGVGNSGKVLGSNGSTKAVWVNAGGGGGYWTESEGTLYPTTISDNVGIGTSSPNYPLHIVGDGTNTGYGISQLAIESSSSEAGIVIDNSGSGGSVRTISVTNNSSGVGGDNLFIGNVSQSRSDITINGSGYVGIGNGSPNAMLTLGKSGALGTYFQYMGTNGQDFVVYSEPQDEDVFRIDGDDSYILFNESGANDWRVGIGTSSPQGVLDVSSGSNRLVLNQSSKTFQAYVNGGDDGIYLYGDGSYADHRYSVYVGDQSSYNQYNNRFQFYNGSFTIGNLGGSGSGIVGVDNDGLLSFSSINSTAWGLNGNSGTSSPTNFIGTTDHRELYVHGDTVKVGSYYNSISFNGLNTITKDSTIYFNGIGILNDSATGASSVGEFSIFKASDGSLDAVQIEFECNNGAGDESTLKITPDVLSYGSYAYAGLYNLILDRYEGLYQMGIINGSIWMDIDSTADKFIFHDGSLQVIDGTEGDGKILTSDASGNASWQDITEQCYSHLKTDSIIACSPLVLSGNSISTTSPLTVNGSVTATYGGDLSGSSSDNITVSKILNTTPATFVKNTMSGLATYSTPTDAHNALGAGKPYILSTTIGIVSVLLQAITP